MKILHVMPNINRRFGGPVESLIGYAKAAGLKEIKVDVAAPESSASDMKWLREQLPGVTFHLFKSRGRHVWIVSQGLWRWLRKNGNEYDVIHIHGLFNPISSFSATICRKKRFRYVIRPFGTLSRYTFSRIRWFKLPWFRMFDKPNLAKADGVHFTTEAEQSEAGRLDLPLQNSGVVVPPPYRGVMAESGKETEKFSEPVCLYMSRLHPKKNVENLIRAWPAVQEEQPLARLIIAGSGDDEYEASLLNLLDELDIKESVEFAGFVTGAEKSDLLNRAWIFALPSHHENFGVAVLEAIAAGLPVVISEDVQLVTFIKETNTGKVALKDPASIAEAITDLFKEKNYRSRVHSQGPKEVQKAFSLESVGEQLKKMYGDVASKNSNL